MSSVKSILLVFILALITSCSSKNTSQETLDGTWIPVSQEIAGHAIPAVAFEKQSLELQDSTYTFTAESVDKGVVQLNGNNMDIYGREGVNKGNHITALYKIENDQLTICYNLMGTDYPKAFETKSNPSYFLSVFKRK